MQTAKGRDQSRVCDEGLCLSIANDSAEVQCGTYDKISERAVRDLYIQRLSSREKGFHGKIFIGQRLLCQYRFIRREDNPRVHQEPRRERESSGEHVPVRSLIITPSRRGHQTTHSVDSV